jgi:glycerol-3-phosphate cytidylyltransferase-like family protein
MEINNNEYNVNSNIIKQYEEKLVNLNAGTNILLDEFNKLYVITKMNPSDQEYQQKYQNTLNSLEEVLSNLFIISNDIQVDTNKINKELFELDGLIRIERDRNTVLKEKLKKIGNTNSASSEMISDYKNMYNYNYLRNWSLLISSLLCLGTIGIIFKQKV